MTRLLVTLLVALAAPGPATARTVHDVLTEAAATARFPGLTRADVRIEREGAAPVAAVLLARGHTVYVETAAGARALIRPGKILIPAAGGRVVRAPVGAPLGTTGLLLEELAVFDPDTLRVPQMSDAGPVGTVVSGAPARPSAYVLLVYNIDEDGVVVRTKYYREQITNLAKLRNDEEPIDVEGHPRPTSITIETFRPPATTTLTLAWRPAPETPAALLTPAGLKAPSGLTF